MSLEFRLKNIDWKKKQNELMSKKHKKVCTTLNHTGHLMT